MPKRNRPEPCRCDEWPFPHRRTRDCDHREADELEAGDAAEETAYQQAMWDLDRSRAIR
jgi:hypothetical protein